MSVFVRFRSYRSTVHLRVSYYSSNLGSFHHHPTQLTSGVYFPPYENHVRSFSKKASKMGKHLEKIEELAHRGESIKAKERKINKQQTLSNTHYDNHNDEDRAYSMTEKEADKEKGKEEEDEEDVDSLFLGNTQDSSIINLPSKEDVKGKMLKVVQGMEASLRSIRGAEPSPELFDSVPVKVYGSIMPLNAVAQVVITGPSMATITCFDPATASPVRDAIRDMEGMNFNPRMEDSGTLTVPIPKVSIETRKSIVKQLNKIAEDNRQRIRRIRRAAQDIVKKGKDGHVKGISKDDAFRVGNQIEEVTEECIKAINEIIDRKTLSVMSI